MLKSDIGINAGTIWNLLLEKERLSIQEIVELTNYKDTLITLSLGWLSREDKIKFINCNDSIYIELNNSNSEMYY